MPSKQTKNTTYFVAKSIIWKKNVKEKGKITNKEYQEINQVSKRTANTDLSELVHKYNIFQPKGASVNICYEIK